MDSIRVVIADDNEGMRLIEAKLIALAEGFDLAGEAADGEALLREVAEKRPQVVFLDVDMPGLNGVECARRIRETAPDTVLIFATAHEGYMGDAFEVYAFDYLVKPFRTERVLETLRRVRSRFLEEEAAASRPAALNAGGRLTIRHREGVAFVPTDEILLVQREERQTVLVCTGGRRFVTGENLSDVEAHLNPAVFCRCHKSYIINLNQIAAIEPYGRWTSIVKLNGTKETALITKEKLEELMGS